MKRKRREAQDEQDAEVNLTPLIDIVFVILIVFILIAPLLRIDKVQLAKAETDASLKAASSIAVYVKQDDSIWFQDKRWEIAELAQQLAHARSTQPDVIPQLVQDRRSHFGVYQQVKNAMERAGYMELELVLQP